ncbi:RHS repeat-associated core domain-containing protein [Tenacibaculum maritimum]|uniref:RHS repeat-associated core domain-containing protein n=3 Tax=Tenacibaculum maritimum TaxID=107401 RepID=UPI00388DBB1A
MLLADTHLTFVVGIDIHFTTMIPFNPFHPYVGMVLDPADYIPFIGTNVHINGLKRGNSDTSGVIVPLVHIPLFTPPWLMTSIIGHESMNFYASDTVFSDSTRLSPKGHMLMTCNDIGIPLSLSVGKGKKFKIVPTLFSPTSFSLPTPTGLPVNVGGPYVPDWGGMLTGLLAGLGFGALMKYGKKVFNKVLKKAIGPNWLSRQLCKAGFEPINLINGAVLYEGVDFGFSGVLALSWDRSWYSDSDYVGWLGHGVHSCYDRALELYPSEDALGLRLEDGRIVGFPTLLKEEEFYLRSEKITLKRISEGYVAQDHVSNTYSYFTAFDVKKQQYQLTRIANADGLGIDFEIVNNRLRRIIDSGSREVNVFYNDAGFISKMSLLSGGDSEDLVSYRYDDYGNMTGIIDALGHCTSMEYVGHLMVKKEDRNGQCFYWEYDEWNRCVHTWGDGGWQEGWITYHKEEGYNLVKDANQAITTYYYEPNQLVTGVKDPMGVCTYTQYTAWMEVYREVDGAGRVTGYSYDDRGNRTSICYADGTKEYFMYNSKDLLEIWINPEGEKTLYVYDELASHRIKSIVGEDQVATYFNYTSEGLLSEIRKEGNVLSLSYDARYNVKTWRENGKVLKRWDYNDRGRVIAEYIPNQMPNYFSYDALDRVLEITGSDGKEIHFRYNQYDEVVGVETGGHEVSFSYTPMGSLSSRTENGVKVSFEYDKMEQLRSIRNERNERYFFTRNRSGKIVKEQGFDGLEKRYRYNEAGEVIHIERGGGRYTSYEQDALGRITRASYEDGSWETYSYNKNGALIAACNQDISIYLERDAKGRVVKEVQSPTLGGGTEHSHEVEIRYNKLGQRTHVVSSLGAEVVSRYNQQGLIASISAQSEVLKEQHKAWEASLEYDSQGRELERYVTGGVHSKMRYHLGNPVGQSMYSHGEQRGYRGYTWDTNHQLLETRSHLNQDPIGFSYDAFGNLARAKYSYKDILFKTPDAVGNLYKEEDQSDRVYGKGGRLLKDEEYHYKYDVEGHLILKSKRRINEKLAMPKHDNILDKWLGSGKPSKEAQLAHENWQLGDWGYVWYGNGRLKEVKNPDGSVVKMEYDALGRRTSKRAQGKVTRFFWDGNVLLHEWNHKEEDTPAVVVDAIGMLSYDKVAPIENLVTWVYESGRFVPSAKLVGGERYSILSDYLGTPIQAYDARGNIVWECELDIYGKVRNLHGEKTFIPFRYQGQYEDVETGLYYNRFRYYSPDTGTYISQDPIGLLGNNPNFYAYVPDVNSKIDPLGLMEIPPGFIRRTATIGDVDMPSIRAARREAMRRLNIPTSQPYKSIIKKDPLDKRFLIQEIFDINNKKLGTLNIHQDGHIFYDKSEFEKPHYHVFDEGSKQKGHITYDKGKPRGTHSNLDFKGCH